MKDNEFNNNLHDAIYPYLLGCEFGATGGDRALHNPKTKWFLYIYILRKNFHNV